MNTKQSQSRRCLHKWFNLAQGYMRGFNRRTKGRDGMYWCKRCGNLKMTNSNGTTYEHTDSSWSENK